MKLLRLLKRDVRGAAAIEMALALPVLVAMIYGIFQVGLLYQANAGMQHALGEGARYATLCVPSGNVCNPPSDTQIKNMITAKLFGKGDGAFTVANPVPGTGYRDLSVSYSRKMNFLFMAGPTITLNRSKRAYTVS
jgi:hypothetical protein